MGKPHRATRDLDLAGRSSPDVARLVAVFREVAAVACPEDGMTFDAGGIVGATIREDARYTGVRIVVPGDLAGARIKVLVDVGLGDATVPQPPLVKVASLLDLPRPCLRAYAPETVVAEKLEALVVLGIATSRMKDLFDLDLLRRTFPFDDTLVEAVTATFARRGTPIPNAETSGTTSVEVQCPECGGTGPTEEYSAYVVCLDALGYSTWDFAGISVRCGEDEEFQVVGCACGTRSRPTGWIGGLGAVLIAWLGSRRRGGPMSRA